MKNAIKNEVIARGAVDIQIFENGELIERIQEKNLVVSLGKANIAKMIGGIAGGTAISQIAVGSNGVPPATGDNAITDQFAKAFDSVTQPSSNSVMFHFDIDNSEANGLTIREFGLLNVGGVLCARKVRTADIVKTNAIRLVGTWTITVN